MLPVQTSPGQLEKGRMQNLLPSSAASVTEFRPLGYLADHDTDLSLWPWVQPSFQALLSPAVKWRHQHCRLFSCSSFIMKKSIFCLLNLPILLCWAAHTSQPAWSIADLYQVVTRGTERNLGAQTVDLSPEPGSLANFPGLPSNSLEIYRSNPEKPINKWTWETEGLIPQHPVHIRALPVSSCQVCLHVKTSGNHLWKPQSLRLFKQSFRWLTGISVKWMILHGSPVTSPSFLVLFFSFFSTRKMKSPKSACLPAAFRGVGGGSA